MVFIIWQPFCFVMWFDLINEILGEISMQYVAGGHTFGRSIVLLVMYFYIYINLVYMRGSIVSLVM